MSDTIKTETIPFARPYIGKEEEEAVLGVLRSGWLTTGKETLEFEKEFEQFLKAGENQKSSGSGEDIYCMAVNSATSGLHLALEAIGVLKGDLVLVPSMTFTSTAEVIRYLGAEAVFVDVSKDTYHMDSASLEQTLERLNRGLPAYPPRSNGGEGFGPRGKAVAVMPVHYGGLPCDMNAILPIAEKYDLKVIEDAAHSFPSLIGSGEWGCGIAATGSREYNSDNTIAFRTYPDSSNNNPYSPLPTPHSPSYAGTLGDAGVFSFYATKTITTGEGGMVVTRNKAIADRVRIMRSHGIDRSIWNRYTDAKASWYYEVVAPGFKYNIPDLLTALGRAQLRRAMDLLSMRRELTRCYDEAFADDVHFDLPPTGPGHAHHLYPLRLKLQTLSIKRDEFAAKIQEQGIGISVHFIPLHTMPYYRERYGLEDGDFPETLESYKRSISLPLWPGMTEAQIKRVITVVKTLGSQYNKI